MSFEKPGKYEIIIGILIILIYVSIWMVKLNG